MTTRRRSSAATCWAGGAKFLAAHPELSLDLSVQDHVIDPIVEGVDVTLRLATLRDSELIPRSRSARCAWSPPARRATSSGTWPPVHPDDLARHSLIAFLAGGAVIPWRFRNEREHLPVGRLHTNSADAAREAALGGR